MAATTLPDCFDCKYGGAEYPCRTADAQFDFAKVGSAIVARARTFQPAGAPADPRVEEDDAAWVTDCEFETIEEHPELLVGLMVAAADACETPEDAAFVAAGLIENAMVKHGPQLIAAVAELAELSPKFSYILSGMWSQGGSVDPEVWIRLGKVVSRHPRMSSDPRAPSDGSPTVVLDADAATRLMSERVADTARVLGLKS